MREHNLIAESATIGAETSFGAFVVIEDDVTIGSGCRIGHHVVIRRGTRIGDGVRIDDHASVGKQPMKAAASAVTNTALKPPPTIGRNAIIGSGAVVYAGCTIGEGVLIADLATVREDVSIGARTIIGRGVAVENHCTIGARCKVETNAYITAYSTIGDNVFIAPGVLTSNDNFLGRTEERFKHFGGVTVQRGGRIGVGAVILPNRTIEEEAVIGAGAVLTSDAEAGRVHVGVPARPVRDVDPTQRLSK